MNSHQSGFSFLKFFLIVLILSGIIVFYIKTQKDSIFPILSIKIASDYHRVSKNHLKKVIASHIQQKNFVTLNITQLKKNLLQIPWILDVTIRRAWPGSLLIKIEEQKPIALFNEKGVINQQGNIFYPNLSNVPKDLPHLIATESEIHAVFKHYQKMALMVKPLKLQIVLIKVSFDENFKAILNNGIVLLLGKTDILTRWKRFVAAYPELLQEANTTHRRIGQIDLRYPNGFAVRWSTNIANHN